MRNNSVRSGFWRETNFYLWNFIKVSTESLFLTRNTKLFAKTGARIVGGTWALCFWWETTQGSEVVSDEKQTSVEFHTESNLCFWQETQNSSLKMVRGLWVVRGLKNMRFLVRNIMRNIMSLYLTTIETQFPRFWLETEDPVCDKNAIVCPSSSRRTNE